MMIKFKNKKNIFFIAFIFCININTQEINPSILKNLTPEQLRIAQKELSQNKPITSPKPVVIESTAKKSIPDMNRVKGKYGYSFFSSVPTSISPLSDLPVPVDYKISLQDQLTVILSGSREGIFDLNVNLDGTILFPELGSIYVAGETFNDVKRKLKNIVKQSYIGVEIDLSIKSLAAKKITIVGAVKTPGTYLVNPFSTISSALAYSGGISEIGTLRNIKLIKTNGDTFSFDLYDLLIYGNRSDDINIEAGDVILIGPAKQFVQLNGAVNRPAIYEITNEETLDDLINFGLGFTETANKNKINLRTLNINESSIDNIETSDLAINLKGILAVDIFEYINKNFANIMVDGAIKEPGYYALDEYKTLESLIESLEFINVYPWLAVLEQFDENNLIKSSILFSLKDPSTFKDIQLLPNSNIYFANINKRTFPVDGSTKTKISEYNLRLNHKQGAYKLPVYGKFSIKSFVDFLGLDMNETDPEATYVSPLESIVIKGKYEEMQFEAKKYHTISFRSQVNDLIQVTISGEIEYPGNYTLESDTTLEDLYQLVGRFKKEAYLDGIIFTRSSIRERQAKSIQKSKQDLNEALLVSTQKGDQIGDINIIRALSQTIEPENLGRIAGDFSPQSFSSINTVLFDGDRIVIPKNPNIISVLGEVLNPLAFKYEERVSVRKAIDNAGGYKDYANKNAVYVIKANGLIEKVNRNIFVRNIKLEPGDTIVVPRKIITNNPGIEALLPITQILSDLAFSAAAVQTLSNNN